MTVLFQFQHHPRERDLIGQIILAYSALEISLMDTVAAALNGDTVTATRTIFRLRSESNRLEVADAIIRPWMVTQKLAGQFDEALTAFRHCKNIRNQYAHASWLNDKGQLRFGDMEEAAQGSGETASIKLHPISLAVLKEQLAYFSYAHHQLTWVTDQYRLKTGQSRRVEPHIPKPKRKPPPRRDSRSAEPTHQLRVTMTRTPPPAPTQ